MTEQIPGAITTSENESNKIEVADFTQGVKINPNDLASEDLFQLFEVSADEDSIWVNFGVGGPA
jgi:hypothetical protein|tara:strand:- start:1453 stop:1644 length:192 start_codon:yes stop_codon:yes gene_type:complete